MSLRAIIIVIICCCKSSREQQQGGIWYLTVHSRYQMYLFYASNYLRTNKKIEIKSQPITPEIIIPCIAYYDSNVCKDLTYGKV